jgi:hypothetical protein
VEPSRTLARRPLWSVLSSPHRALEAYYEENEDPVVGTSDLATFVLAFFAFFAAFFSAFLAIFSSLPCLTTMRTSEVIVCADSVSL